MNRIDIKFFNSAIKFKRQMLQENSPQRNIDSRTNTQMRRRLSSTLTSHKGHHKKYSLSKTNESFSKSRTSINKSVALKNNKRVLDFGNEGLSVSLNVLKSKNIANMPKNIIKSYVEKAYSQRTRRSKENLCECLLKHHNFFKKINPTLAQAFTLLGFVQIYQPNSLIFQASSEQPHRSQNDLGILLYGKVEFRNDEKSYRHISKQCQVFFQHKYIRVDQPYEYYGQTLCECAILWIPRENYYIVRRESFLQLDLKYKFHEFQNLLKFYLVHKKLQPVKLKWKFFRGGKIEKKQLFNQ